MFLKMKVSDILVTEYFKMPPISRGYNFDKCMEESHDLQVFCAVNTFIKPNRDNFVWNIIEVR